MYSFELNIGSLTTPVAGGGWVDVTPFQDDSTINNKIFEKESFSRITLDGSLTFSGDDFDALLELQSSNKIAIRATHTNNSGTEEIVYVGELDLLGSWDLNAATCKLKADVNDRYTNVIEKRKDEINILNSGAVSCEVARSKNRLFFSLTQIAESTLWITPGAHNLVYPAIYAREQRRVPNQFADILVGGSGNWVVVETHTNEEKTIARPWDELPFTTPVDATHLQELTGITSTEMNEIQAYSQLTPSNEYTTVGVGDSTYTLFLKNWIYYSDDKITYSRFRIFQNIIEYMMSQIDTAVLFDQTTFSYFDSNTDLQYLLIANASDLIPDSGSEKSDNQDFLKLTWEQITNWLRDFAKIYWYIDSNNYLRFENRGEFNYTEDGTNPDLADLEGKDWSINKYQFLLDEKYSRLKRKLEAGNLDFIGADLVATNLFNIRKDKSLSSANIYTDIWDVQDSTDYANDSEKNGLLLASKILTETALAITYINSVAFPCDTFSWVAGTLSISNTTSHTGIATDQFNLTTGFGYQLTMNVVSVSGVVRVNIPNSTPLFFRDLVVGVNAFLFSSGLPSIGTDVQVIISGIGSAVINTFVFNQVDFSSKSAIGVLTGESVVNADLSLANLDAGHGKYEFPDDAMVINTASETITATVRFQKDKEVEMDVPIFNPLDINERKLINTNIGTTGNDIEFKSLSIPLVGSMPILKGVYK